MNTVERIKMICKERKIPISRLEKDLHFGNAYISGLKKGSIPADRLKLISEYLNLSVDYLITGQDTDPTEANDHTGPLTKEIGNDTELSQALLTYFQLPAAKKRHVIEMIQFLGETL